MELTEGTVKEINRYFRRLVKLQPGWLKDLFETDKVAFVMDPSGMLQLEMDVELNDQVKLHAQSLIHKYLSKHPAKFIRAEAVN